MPVKGSAMQIHRLIGIVGLLLAACTGMRTTVIDETKAALAPTGTLRVAFLLAPVYATKDPSTGELKGVAVDLGKELARQLEVPFAPVIYTSAPALIGGAKAGEWDIVLTGISPERAMEIDFSPPYMEVEQGCLVRGGVPITAASDVDTAGIRVGVLEKSFADAPLSRSLKSASLVRAKTLDELYALLESGKADVLVSGKTGLFSAAVRLAGSRVVEGRILSESLGLGLPKGRLPTAAEYVTNFVEAAKSNGQVQASIEKAGLRGVVVAP